MIHKQLVIGMMSSMVLLTACEPVDEAVEQDSKEIEEVKTSGAGVFENSETEIIEDDSTEEASNESSANNKEASSADAEASEDAEETTEEVPAEASNDVVMEEDAGYEVNTRPETDKESKAEVAEAAEAESEAGSETDESDLVYDIEALDLPSPEDLPLEDVYIEVNDNVPLFTNEDLEVSEPFHSYESRDELGRVGVADALLDVELMPAEQRGSISHIDPTGWNQGNYDVVSGNWLYNRSHLIGHQMTGYDGKNNLMTGTRQFNVEGMLPFENFVASVVEDTEMQVRYRVTPLFEDDNLLAHGIVMEGFSVDDNGETLTFNVFVPNQQDGIELDYETGDHALVE